MSCEHEDGCGCGDDWDQMRREAYQAGKRVGKAGGEKAAEARIVAWLKDGAREYEDYGAIFTAQVRREVAREIKEGEHREGK
jgi:hypothetical protein